MSFCAFAQVVTTFIFFSAWDKSHVKWDNSRNSTQKMRTIVLDPFSGEYWILYCLERSSSDSTGVSRRETVRNAAKLAVYEAIMMKPNSHHVAATSRPDRFFGASPFEIKLWSCGCSCFRLRGRSQTTFTGFWLFLTTYPPAFTFSMVWTLTKSGHFWTIYLPWLVYVVCERPIWEKLNKD